MSPQTLSAECEEQRVETASLSPIPSPPPLPPTPTVHCLLNSVVSGHAFFGTIDLTDFYLGTHPQFIKIYIASYSLEVLSRLRLHPFVQTDKHSKKYIIFHADKTLYGVKEAGKLSNLQLVRLLLSFGFVETSTPCLFRHPTRPITFCLVVDDFGVKHTDRHDFDYLFSCLATLYHVKAHPLASRFLGFTIHHDRQARTLSLAYPGYIDALLARLRPEGIRPCSTPSVYVHPRYGLTTPQSATIDHEPPPQPLNAKSCKSP
jgi:hypothetical protein